LARRAVPRPPRAPTDAPASSPLRLPASIDRDDVAAIVSRCRPIVECGDPPAPPCDARDVADPRLPTIEVLAFLALAARRRRRELRLEHASPALIELLELCGLEAIVQRTVERGAGGRAHRARRSGR
jgi:hypothetical protein